MLKYSKIYHQLNSENKKILNELNQRLSYSSMNYISCNHECLDFAQSLLECEQNGMDVAQIYDHDLNNYINQIIARNPKIHWYEHLLNGIYYITICGIALFLLFLFIELVFPSEKGSISLLSVSSKANICVIGMAGGISSALSLLVNRLLAKKSIQAKPWKTVLLPYFIVFLLAYLLIGRLHLDEAIFTLDLPRTASILLISFAFSKSLRTYFAKKQIHQITA